MITFGRLFAPFRGVVLLTLLLSAITVGAISPRADAQESSPTALSRTEYPVTIKNCGVDLTFASTPQRVIIMEPSPVAILSAIGTIDRVVARIGPFPTEYFSDDINSAVVQIPDLVAGKTSTGGATISLETVLDLQPDLIIGYETETITREDLAKFGIGLYVIPPYCDQPPAVSFDNVYAEVNLYGLMFDRVDAAEMVATSLEQRVGAVLAQPVAHGENAAALYVSSDGSAIYAYSRLGMVHVQMTALGLTNLYADLPERVSEVSIETLIQGNPDVLILLYSDTSKTPEEIASVVTDLPGAPAISAIQNDRVYPLLFNFSEPPGPLAVDGLSLLAKRLAE